MKLDDHEEQPMTEEPPQVPNDDHPEDDAILSDDEELEREFDADEGEQTQQPEQPKKREFVSETAFHRYLMAYRKQVNPEEDAEEDVELELEADSEELKRTGSIGEIQVNPLIFRAALHLEPEKPGTAVRDSREGEHRAQHLGFRDAGSTQQAPHALGGSHQGSGGKAQQGEE